MGQQQSGQQRTKSAGRRPHQVRGITVVNPSQSVSTSASPGSNKSVELQKLDRLHRFWPILRSSLDYESVFEPFETGLNHDELVALCSRYQQHLNICAQTTAAEQQWLTRRMKDIEMFTTGIAQQLTRRQDKIERVIPQLERVTSLSDTLEQIQKQLDDIAPLVNRLNNLLPESERMEPFILRPVHIEDPVPVHRSESPKYSSSDDDDEEATQQPHNDPPQ